MDYNGLPMKMPTDLPTYAMYHMHRNLKHIDQSTSLYFCDLTPSEQSTSFLLSLTEASRTQLANELTYQTLLDTAAWLADTHKIGCMKCASFLNR